MAAPRGGTKERLLDAAEELFAAKGFDGASTRDIVSMSGDTIGSVNYHFGSKQGLLAAVMERRWNELSSARRQFYEAEKIKAASVPDIEAAIASVVLPYLDRAMRGDAGWRSYTLLQARLIYSPEAYEATLMHLSEPMSQEILGWLQIALPDAHPVDVGYAFQFMVSTMIEGAAEVGVDRLRRITGGVASSRDYAGVSGRMIRFIAAGVRAICPEQSK